MEKGSEFEFSSKEKRERFLLDLILRVEQGDILMPNDVLMAEMQVDELAENGFDDCRPGFVREIMQTVVPRLQERVESPRVRTLGDEVQFGETQAIETSRQRIQDVIGHFIKGEGRFFAKEECV